MFRKRKSNVEAVGKDGDVTMMLDRLNLSAGEDERVVMSDDDEEETPQSKWSVIGKALSPSVLHLQTIMGAMKPAWGNPRGLQARSVGDNLFIDDSRMLLTNIALWMVPRG